jgi:Na+-translocating ferredoxin:NAD+ oxidoreductase RnfA subunit
MVPSFTSTNISAFGGLTLAALLYMAIGAALSWIVKEIFYVPVDFQWGIIVVSRHVERRRG